MHICFLSVEYPLWNTGGIGSFIQTIGTNLVRNGHQVTVVGVGTDNKPIEFNDQGVRVVRLARSNWKKLSFIPNNRAVYKFLKRLNQVQPIDIVESPEVGFAFMPWKTPFKKVIRLHGGHHFFAIAEKRAVNPWKGFQEKLSFLNADGFIAVSNYVRDHTANYLSYHSKPVKVIRLPLDTNIFCPDNTVPVEPFLLVFAGTVCEKKGVRQLLEALPMIAERFPQVKLHIYGRDWLYPDNSSYIKQLKSNTDEATLSRVTFFGPVKRPQIAEAFRKAHLCVFPSHMETFGLVAPEAMLTGRPVLFSINGPGPEIVNHLKTGLLCNPSNVSDIADKIIWAFEHPEKLDEIANVGYKTAVNDFNLNFLIDENTAFYSSLK